ILVAGCCDAATLWSSMRRDADAQAQALSKFRRGIVVCVRDREAVLVGGIGMMEPRSRSRSGGSGRPSRKLSKAEAGFGEPAAGSNERCANCCFFYNGIRCRKVRGHMTTYDWCRKFEPSPMPASRYRRRAVIAAQKSAACDHPDWQAQGKRKGR